MVYKRSVCGIWCALQVLSPSLTVPLWDADTLGPTAFPNNAEFVRQHTVQLLSHSFPNMHQQQIVMFVEGLFETRSDFSSFKGKLRDFLVQSKEWTAGTEVRLRPDRFP